MNRYSGIRVEPDRVTVGYVVDFAEVATFQARDQIDLNAADQIDDTEQTSYATRVCGSVAPERLFPWLRLASGAILAVLGACRSRRPA